MARWVWGCFKLRSMVPARLVFAAVERSQVWSGQGEVARAQFDAKEAERSELGSSQGAVEKAAAANLFITGSQNGLGWKAPLKVI